MTTPSLCPDARRLQQMLSGVLPLSDDEAAQLEQHLRECGRCESLADVFPDNDTLIEALRTQADASEVQHPLIQQLVARLSRLQAPGSEVTIGLSQSQDAALAPPLSPDEIGRLGGYRVLKVLGAGGMGMVYQAEDVQLQRAIALKVMKAEVSNNPGNRERFLREARAAAKLKSDHVVNIYQVGEERQVVFLAMEFLEGMALDDWLKKGRTPTWAQAARIGRQIALGLADAHACGLIHRDIKPGNIWLDSRHQGRVKLLDFGLARGDSEEVHLTQSGAIVGTPAYMAPEQARGEKVDFRADLFSLGVVLYRMTTGQLPFRGDNTMSILTALALDAPKPPREISAEMPPRLAALIERLLAKDRAQRPATAKAVADELAIVEREATQPAADERTVQVRAASVSAPVGPTARSRSRLRWLAAASLLLLLGGIAAAVVVIIRDKQGHKVAEINLPEGHSVEVKADDKDKGKPPEKDKKPAAAIPADPLAKIEPGTPLGPMALVTNPAPLPGVRSWTIETRMPRGGINAVAYRPDGRLLATAGDDSVIRLLDPKSGQVIRALVGHMAQVTLLAWSPDGRTLASGSWDGTVRLWDADSGRSLRTLTGLAQPHALAWSTDGRSVLGCCNPDILTWDAVTGKTLHKVSLGKVVMQPAFSPDGKLLAGESDGHTVRIWEARTGREVRTLKGHTAALHKVAWSPDGKRLASAASGDAVRGWNTETGKEVWSIPLIANSYNPLAWSPDGRTLVLDTADRHSSVLDLMAVDNPGALRTVPACADAISVSWSPDGKTVASGGIFGDVAVTDVETGARTELHPGPAMSHLTGLAWSPDSKQLAAATYGAVTRVVNPTTGEATATLTDAGQVSAWSPSKWLAAAGPGPDYQLLLWQPGGGRRVLPAHKSGGVRSLAWSPDGKTLADAGTEQDLRLWDGAMRQAKATWNVGPVVPGTPPAWSPDGKLLAICIQDGAVGKVKVLRTDSGEEQRAIPNFNSAAWSPVGETLAVFNGYYPNVQLVNAKTGEAGVRLTTGGQDGWSPGGVLAVAWSPDGKLLAIGCIGEAGSRCMSSIQVWDPATGERLRKFDRVCLYNITNLAWSPEGKRIAACSGQTIQLWDAETGQPSGVILHNPQYHGLSLRADGHYRGDAKVEEAIVMVVQKEDGSTETLPPAEFAKTYGGKQGDAPPESAPDKQPDKDKPFVLLRDNKEVRAFKTLFGVFNEMQSGDTIEVHGNGPFPLGLVRLQGKDLSLSAAPGYRPTFVPSRPMNQQDHAWFEIKDGTLHVAGCDFRQPNNCIVFSGGGKSWELRNCRLWSFGPLAEYAGPRLRMADSLASGSLWLGPKVELELDNNILRQGEYDSIVLRSPGDQTVHLRNNTIHHCALHSAALFVLQDARGVSVEAVGNILLFSGTYRHLFHIQAKDGRDRVRWSGRQNLYAGLSAPVIVWNEKATTNQLQDLEGKPLVADVKSPLSKLLGRDEEGSRLTPADPERDAWCMDGLMLFRRHQVRLQDQAGIVRILRETTARLRQRPGLADVGPDWDVIGSGDAYVRALAAVGKPVAKDNLRPEAEEGGPFTLLRAGVAKGRGFDTLQNALNAIVPGDVIEIRSDGPFVGGGVTVAGVLTIRAAPGYRAVVDGNVTIAKGDVTLEGLHFRTGGPMIDPNGSHLVRLANCFFETRPNGRGFVARVGPGKQTEVVNCLTLDMLDGYLEKDGKLALRNSVVGSLIAGVDASSRVDLDRCLFWGPATKYLVWNGGRKDPLSISARRTILEDGGAGYLLYGLQHWKGSQNVYRIGAVDFSLDDWRKRWKEAEEGSVEDEPLILDPRQWRLLPQSPGYHAGTNGKDLGAEVDRIAVPTGLGESARTK